MKITVLFIYTCFNFLVLFEKNAKSMYKNQRILYSENAPENTPENEPENQPENGPQMSFGTKNIFSSKILFNNEFQ